MALGAGFEWLSGTVTVPAQRPEAWGANLDEFYRAPNDDRWGGQLCRVLYHESIHFWQLLSSAFLANWVQQEWLRLRDFEERGTWDAAHGSVDLHHIGADHPFSAFELLECWARYWDVHTRHAGRILQEDGIDLPATRVPGAPAGAYTSFEFDAFMQRGRDAAVYARPYRWALERADGNSAFVNCVFPTVVFCAFGSPDPVGLFVAALDRARESPEIHDALRVRSGSVNMDWLTIYRAVIGEAVAPTVADMRFPSFTGGWDVLARGRLREHPVYGPYLRRIEVAMSSVRMFNTDPPSDDSIDEQLRFATAVTAVDDPLVVFMFPGQPSYRMHLGRIVPPPRVRFADVVWHAEREFAGTALAKLHSVSTGDDYVDVDRTLAPVYEDLDRRVRRFRDAQYAVSRGLPADTFAGQPG